MLPGKRVIAWRPRYRGAARAHIVARGLALVPEGRGIFGDLTVKENLLLGANPRRARDGEAARREQVLELFPRLRERAGQSAHHERRRTADARDRPRADVQPGDPAARRAVARAPPPWCRNSS